MTRLSCWVTTTLPFLARENEGLELWRSLLRLFALPLPGFDAFEELLDNALESCVILLSGGQVAQFVDTVLDLDGHSIRLMGTP